MKRMVLGLGCILLSACATTPVQVSKIQDIDRATVKELGCVPLGKVSITTNTKGQTFAEGLETAKNLAREDAEAMGASHILWTDTARGYISAVRGEAYRCDKKPANPQ